MKLIQITPGSGDNYYCENCLRDISLVRTIQQLGHDVLMVPLYLPLRVDQAEQLPSTPVFYGGVNVYLQQKLALFKKTPAWVDRLRMLVGLPSTSGCPCIRPRCVVVLAGAPPKFVLGLAIPVHERPRC